MSHGRSYWQLVGERVGKQERQIKALQAVLANKDRVLYVGTGNRIEFIGGHYTDWQWAVGSRYIEARKGGNAIRKALWKARESSDAIIMAHLLTLLDQLKQPRG